VIELTCQSTIEILRSLVASATSLTCGHVLLSPTVPPGISNKARGALGREPRALLGWSADDIGQEVLARVML
jgi:hypothetical protein